ncbi:GreA/GreB family elongation factor [Bacillus cereus]|uniref:GreA/GreB family elongation factor n=1 Tax=Bacillus cereus TaxID=1396 RepID=UPI0011420FF9|nr:GreA/GreB family elongation factor [Bacillus cereus]
MNNQQKYYLTDEQKNQRQARLEEIINIELPENAEEIERAKAQGDLSENAEYDAAKEHQAKLYKEKTELENLLNNAIIIKENESNDKVEIGHSVTIEWSDGKTEVIKLLGYGNGKTEISIDSPLGSSLIGKRINDSVIIEAPIGRLQLKVLEIN